MSVPIVQTLLTLPARNLAESAQQLQQSPLSADDSRYIPLTAARGTRELTKLEIILENAAGTANAFAKCAFVGSRGSGKSTYLLHLERDLEEKGLFTPVHVYLDPSLETDCDYSDLFLWMVDEIARQFADKGHPMDETHLDAIAHWFADKSDSTLQQYKKEIELSTQTDASSTLGIPVVFALKLLARLKSKIVGSEESRREIRKKVQNYATELRNLMNAFLDHARDVLAAAGKPARLLIIQDNLDRLRPREKAQHLFDTGGDMLVSLRADIIYTAPLVLNLAPLDIRQIFPHVCTMPNVKLRLQNGRPHRPGHEALVELIARRLDISLTFKSKGVVEHLVDMSGGSVRDLLRLVDEAQLEAQASGKDKVDLPSAKAAVKKMSINFTRLLVPGSVFYPILAEVRRTKREFTLTEAQATQERVDSSRAFFADLIGNGTILEYNGDDSWYDVHPAVCEIGGFKDALVKAQAQAPTHS